jgi:hypothetical protein
VKLFMMLIIGEKEEAAIRGTEGAVDAMPIAANHVVMTVAVSGAMEGIAPGGRTEGTVNGVRFTADKVVIPLMEVFSRGFMRSIE